MAKKTKGIILLVLLVVVVFSFFLYQKNQSPTDEARARVVSTEYQNEIVATGNIKARDDIILKFETGGNIQEIFYEPGDVVAKGSIIAHINPQDLQTEVNQQRLRLQKELLLLQSLINGPDKEERDRITADVEVSTRQLENEVRIALASAQQSANSIENIIRKDIDVLFDGIPEDPRIQLKYNLPINTEDKINNRRLQLEEIFEAWRSFSNRSGLTHREVLEVLESFEGDLRKVSNTLLEIQDALLPRRALSEENEQIFLIVSATRQRVLDSIVEVSRSINQIKAVESQYNLKVATSAVALEGSTDSQITQQEAQIETERERLRQVEIQLEKTKLVAPFTGVIGGVFVNEGELASAGTNAVRFVSNEGFDISVDITEVEIRRLSVGQEIRAELDATDEEIIVRVRTIDTTERILSNVPVYQVVFDVLTGGKRGVLRPGLTTDVFIPIDEKRTVLAIPSKAIQGTGENRFVTVEVNGEQEDVAVTVGGTTREGLVVVEGDFNEGDTVIVVDK